jgi:hypothetical protein
VIWRLESGLCLSSGYKGSTFGYIYEDMILRWIWRRSLDIPPTILTVFLYRYRAATRTREPFCICWCNTVERYEVGKRSDRAEFELKSGNIAICLPIIALPSACRPLDPREGYHAVHCLQYIVHIHPNLTSYSLYSSSCVLGQTSCT